MTQEIAINSTDEETRVAVLENRSVTELYIDRQRNLGIVGNVYNGKVVKVLPGMQAAFVDIGQERAAFLYVADITTNTEENASFLDGDQEDADSIEYEAEASHRSRSSHLPIEDLLQEGQEVTVQVTKAPMGTKGPRVTTYVSLPGRYLVYMPTVNHVGVSRRIEEASERSRLRNMILELRKGNTGYIIRTASEGRDEDEFRADIEFLDRIWKTIIEKRESSRAPCILHSDLDIILRTIRDLFTNQVERLIVDSKAEYQRVKEFVDSYLPDLTSRVEIYTGEEPLFEDLQIEMEVSKALNRKVWLKSGGYIVFDHTEALTVIDVNTGRFVGKRHLEDTILKTNLEAVKEIAYQLRLRNIGGIIIIDFIDMERERNREKVYQAFQDALTDDRAKNRILKISELGLVEMSRERTRQDLLRVLCDPCSTCDSRGYTKSPSTLCYEIFREIRKIGGPARDKKIVVSTHPEVASLLYDEERKGIEDLEREFHKKIVVKADSTLHIEQYDVVTL